MTYIKQIINYTLFTSITLLTLGCGNKVISNEKLIEHLIKDSLGYKDNYNSIVVFQEKGCIHCQHRLFDFIKENKTNKNILFIIQSDEQLINLSELKEKQGNIIFDYKKYLYNYNVVNGSSAILFNGSKIDTIMPLDNSSSLSRNITFIKNRIDN